MLKHVPNALTCLRILLAPCFVLLYLLNRPAAALIVFIIGSITDVLDGFIARRFHCISSTGKALDPLADKLTLIAILMCLYIAGRVPLWLLLLLVLRELTMILGGVILWQNKVTFASDHYGKITTVLFFSASVLLFPWHHIQPLVYVGKALLLLSLACSLTTLVHYFRLFMPMLISKQSQAK